MENLTTKVITGEVRFSYLHVFTPHAVQEGQPQKYSVSLLIPKSDKATLTQIRQAINNAKEVYKHKWDNKIPAKLADPLRDGDEERPDNPEYAGHYFVNAKSDAKPDVVDARLVPITNTDNLYSGCYGRASINFYGYSASGNKGIACGLNNVQKYRDGEALGGKSRAEDDFTVVDLGSAGADFADFLA